MSDNATTRKVEELTNDAMSPLFEAVIEATEEAIYNSMFKATTVMGNGHTVEALPIDKAVTILREHGLLKIRSSTQVQIPRHVLPLLRLRRAIGKPRAMQLPVRCGMII